MLRRTTHRLTEWLLGWNPLLHGLLIAFGLDLAVDALWGNGNVNISVFLVALIVATTGSIVLQRRRAARAHAQQPAGPGQPIDADGVELVAILARSVASRGSEREWLWARQLDDDLYRLRPIPVVARGLNRNDVVSCRHESGHPEVVTVAISGGHRTVRVDLGAGQNTDRFVEQLPFDLSLVTRSGGRAVTIDVHPEEQYEDLVEHLDRLQGAGELTWEDVSGRAAGLPS